MNSKLTKLMVVIVATGMVFGTKMPAFAASFTIDFEVIPGGVGPFEGQEISDQFAGNGVKFALGSGAIPILSQVGSPRTAFSPVDTPREQFEDRIGNFFITAPNFEFGPDEMLIVNYLTPSDGVSGDLIDIDSSEIFNIEIFDNNDNLLDSVSLDASSPGAGNGGVTRFSFERSVADITRLEITTNVERGIGFDNFSAFSSSLEPPLRELPAPGLATLFGLLFLGLQRFRRRFGSRDCGRVGAPGIDCRN